MLGQLSRLNTGEIMNKFVCFLIYFLSIPFFTYASASNTQSKLEKNIALHQSELTRLSGAELLKAYTNITYKEKQNNPDTALHYFSLAVLLLEDHPNFILESDLNTNIAWVYITKGDYEKATSHAEVAFALGKQANDYRRQHNGVTALGAIALYSGDTGTGLNYFKQALRFARLGKVIENEGTSLHNLAMMYTQLGDLDIALEYLILSRDLNLSRNKLTEAAASEAQIAEIYALMGNVDKAIPYFESSIATHEKTNNTFYIAKTKVMLARALSQVERLEEAQQTIQQAISLLKSTGEDIHLRDELIASGNIYLAQKKYQKAIGEYNKALASAEKVESDDEIYQVAQGLARAYFYIDKNTTALKFSQLALEKAHAVQNDIAIEQVEAILAKIYANEKDYLSAYQHLQTSVELNIGNRKKEVSDKNEQIESRFQTAKKEKQIELLTKDNALQVLKLKQKEQEQYFWIACFLIFLLSASFLIYRQNQKRKLANERTKLMTELIDKKNQLLADVSHELRSPLSVLHLKVEALQSNLVEDIDASYEGLLAKINEINHLISDIYQLSQSDIGALNLNLAEHNCLKLLMLWSDEFADTTKLNGFTWHQQLKVPSQLSLVFDHEKIKQVLTNLIDNSMAYTDKPGSIGLSVMVRGKKLSIRVEDSSPSVDKEHLEPIFERLYRVESSRSRATGGSGLGLAICRSIIEAHGGSIVAKQSKKSGLAITIKLPLFED